MIHPPKQDESQISGHGNPLRFRFLAGRFNISSLIDNTIFFRVNRTTCQNIFTKYEKQKNGEQIRVCIDQRPAAAESNGKECPRGTGLRLFRRQCPAGQWIAKPHTCFANLLDPLFQRGLVASTKLVPICPRIEPDKPTGPPDRYPQSALISSTSVLLRAGLRAFV